MRISSMSNPAMRELQQLLRGAVDGGVGGGAAALVAGPGATELPSAVEVETDSIMRIASITKPITAAAVMVLVDRGACGAR